MKLNFGKNRLGSRSLSKHSKPGAKYYASQCTDGSAKIELSIPPNTGLDESISAQLHQEIKRVSQSGLDDWSMERKAAFVLGKLAGAANGNKSNEKSGEKAALPKEIYSDSHRFCFQAESPIDGKISKYEIGELIGQGGMSCVLKARQTETGQIFACKVLLPKLLNNPDSFLRFKQEAQAAMSLSHPDIVAVHAYGNTNDQAFIIMDYLEGFSLATLINEGGRLSVKRALPLFLQIAGALAYAHSRSVIHRDIKPANIVLVGSDEISAKIVDFGIAKILRQHTELSRSITKPGDVFGSPSYMSPEQCMGEKVDKRSDIYSFGILMYEVITGKPPFDSDETLTTIYRQVNDRPARLRNIDANARLTGLIEKIVFKCLEKNAAARYQNMAELIKDLELAAKSTKDVSFKTNFKLKCIRIAEPLTDALKKMNLFDHKNQS